MTALLLLGFFTVVNIAALVLIKRSHHVEHEHLRALAFVPVLGA